MQTRRWLAAAAMSILAAGTAVQGLSTAATAQPGSPTGPNNGHGIERQYPKYGEPDTAYPFIDQHQQGQLAYFGGPVLHTDETYAVFWGPDGSFPAGYEALVQRFLTDVAHDSGTETNVFSVPNQYGDTSGPITYQSTYAGSAVDTDPFPNDCQPASGYSACYTDAGLQTELGSFLSAQGIAHPANRVFLVFTPQDVETCIFSTVCNNNYFCAYHSGMTTTTGDVLYANLPYDANSGCAPPGRYPNANAADPVLNSLSHELKETITDPLVWKSGDANLGWIDPTNGDEADDKCAGYFGPTRYNGVGDYNQVINGHDYLLQSEWSNALGAINGEGCVLDGSDHQPSATFTTKTKGQELSAGVTSTSDPDPGDHVDPRTIHWVFGDGASAFGASTSHHYAAPGTYTLALKVTDTRGGTALYTRTITVTSSSAATAHTFSATTSVNINQDTLVMGGSGNATTLGVTLVGGSIVGYDFTGWPVSFVEDFSGQLVANNDFRQPGKPTSSSATDSLSFIASLTHTDAADPPAGDLYRMTGTFTVTGGTGKYYGATGGGTITGTCTSSFSRPDEDCTLHWSGVTSTG